MKTNLDVYLSAQKAAVDLLGIGESHAVHSAALAAFNEAKNHPADWDYWFTNFNQMRNHYLGLKTQPTASHHFEARKAAEAKLAQTQGKAS